METTGDKKCCETKKCGCFCHKMCGVFIILIGAATGFGCIGIQTLLDHHFNPHHFGGIESDVSQRVQVLRQILNV